MPIQKTQRIVMGYSKNSLNIAICLFTFLQFGLSTAGLSLQTTEVDSLFSAFPKTKVVLLGTFHFKDAGLDSYKPEYDVNITSEKRQQELKEVLKKIESFNPDAIGLEVNPAEETRLNEAYQKYRNNNFELPANEIYQMGFRLGKRLHHQKLFGVDAKARYYSDIATLNQEQYETLEQKYIDSLRSYAPETKQWYPTYEKLYQYQDRLKTKVPLIEYFRYLNDPETIIRSHGIYLVDSFKFGMGMKNDYFGADMKTAWYNRNLRILQNIYRMIHESKAERIVVIIGAGHLPILFHAVQASPELELIPVSSILK